MKVLITGSSGFIGSHLKTKLPTATGLDVVPSEYTDIVADINSFKTEKKFDVIYHLAAETDVTASRGTHFLKNVASVSTALALLKKDGLFVYTSSIAVRQPKTNIYALTKLLGELVAQRSGRKHVVFRLANVYGKRSKSVVTAFLRENPLTIYGTGEQTRDFVFIDDVLDCLVTSELEPQRIYYVGTGVRTSINSLAETVKRFRQNILVIRSAKRAFSEILHPPVKTDFACPTSLEEGIKKLACMQ